MTFDISNLTPTQGQKDLAAYIKRETGKVVKAETIAAVDALRVEFRKDPEQVAKRQQVKDAARKREEAALERHLAKAKALAEKLGHPVDLSAQNRAETLDAALGTTKEPETEKEPEEVEEVATVTPISEAPSRRVVENTFGADTSNIVTEQSDDGWAVDGEDDGEDDF